MATLTLTGATDLTVTGLVEGPPGVFHLPDVTSSQMSFVAPSSDPAVTQTTTLDNVTANTNNVTIVGAAGSPGLPGQAGQIGPLDPTPWTAAGHGGSLVNLLASIHALAHG